MDQQYFVSGGAYSSPVKSNNNKKKFFIIFAGLTAIALMYLGLTAIFNNSSNEKISRALITSIQQNKSDEAYGYISDLFKSTITKDSWDKFMTDTNKLIKDGEIELKYQDKSSSDSVLYTYRIKTKDNGIVNSEIRVNITSNKIDNLSFNRTLL